MPVAGKNMRQFQWPAMTARTGLGLGLGRRARLARAAFAVVSVGGAVASVLVAPGTIGFCGASLALVMCAIALHDARYFLIPNWLSALAFALALGHAAARDPHAPLLPIGIALVRAGVTGGLFLALKLGYGWLRGHEGIGLGDVKLAAVAGAWLDWFALLVGVEIAVVAALGAYLVRHHVGKRPMRATHALPFGLYLAPAIWVAWFLQVTVLAT